MRRAALTVGGPYAKRRHWAGEMPLSFVARPWCNVSAAASNAKPVPRVLRSVGALCSLSLTTRRITKLAGRARQVTLVVVDLGSTRGHCAGKRTLSSIARPWCNAPATASNAKPVPRVFRSAAARCARYLWGGGAALELPSRARRAALVVADLCPIRDVRRREASLLRRASVVRRATCGLQLQASAACFARRTRALCSLSLGKRRSTRASFARAPCGANCRRPIR